MPSVQSAISTPGTNIVTTAETLAANIPPSPLAEPSGSPQTVIIRGGVKVATGSGVGALIVTLRVGQNNTATAAVGAACRSGAGASATGYAPFTFIDPAGLVNLVNSGYSITITQIGATGNGTVSEVVYEVDYSSH